MSRAKRAKTPSQRRRAFRKQGAKLIAAQARLQEAAGLPVDWQALREALLERANDVGATIEDVDRVVAAAQGHQ